MTFAASSKSATERSFSSLKFAKSSGFFNDSCFKPASPARSEAQQAAGIVSQKIPRIGVGLCAFPKLDFRDVKSKSRNGHMIRSLPFGSLRIGASIDAERLKEVKIQPTDRLGIRRSSRGVLCEFVSASIERRL